MDPSSSSCLRHLNMCLLLFVRAAVCSASTPPNKHRSRTHRLIAHTTGDVSHTSGAVSSHTSDVTPPYVWPGSVCAQPGTCVNAMAKSIPCMQPDQEPHVPHAQWHTAHCGHGMRACPVARHRAGRKWAVSDETCVRSTRSRLCNAASSVSSAVSSAVIST